MIGLSEKLLALAASTTWDGGEGLVRTLDEQLRDIAPHEGGEIVIHQPDRDLRLYLGTQEAPLAGADLLQAVSSASAPRRFDDLTDLETFPQTREAMSERGQRSLLAVSLQSAGGPEGLLALTHRQAWAFAGVGAGPVVALAAMAGLCLERAMALTRLREERSGLPVEGEPAQDASHAGIETLRAAISEIESERDGLRVEVQDLRQRLESATPAPGAKRPSKRRSRRRRSPAS